MMVSYPIKSGRKGRHVQLDDNGRGVAIRVPPGSIEFYFGADGFETTVLRVSVGDEMAPVQVHLTPGR